MAVAAEGAAGAARPVARFSGKYLSVASFRRDGTPVATPVWFVEDDGKLFVDTDAASYKVRRIRVNPSVLIAPCTASGKTRSQPVKARAEVVAAMPERARRLYEHKYRVDKVFVLPIYRLMQALRRKKDAPSGESVALVITPG